MWQLNQNFVKLDHGEKKNSNLFLLMRLTSLFCRICIPKKALFCI